MMFRKNPYFEKPNTRKAIKYYRSDENYSRDLHASLYAHMFMEDLHLGIMPIGGRSTNPNFAVKIEPSSKEIEELMKLGLPTHHGEPHDITEAVCDFIDEVAHILAYYGKAYYEIVYFYADENKQKIDSFRFENIPNHCIKETFGFYWQYLPKKIIESNGENIINRFNWLPKKDILVFCIPRQLGGFRKFKKLLSELQWLSKCTIPEFVIEDMAVKQQSNDYDFSVYRENQEIFLAKATSKLGWTARRTFMERTLEFYQIYRYLKFEKTKAILREYILHKLNYTLGKIGEKLGFNAKVKTEGIPSSQDYDNYMAKLIDGSLQFSEVVKLMRL
ncbi:MAG: hypothetical protein NC918_01305 [Candidatus Omnitrophica bacterium]|nr:hypothetical protein [Candidatus Omnitrophota bacterium]